jgi:hypothetical protein
MARGDTTLTTRYPVCGVNLLRSLTHTHEAADFELVNGVITWNGGKAPTALTTRLTVHYLMHPVWRVVEHPKSLRDQYIQKKMKRASLDTAVGNRAQLPLYSVVKYDFLVS